MADWLKSHLGYIKVIPLHTQLRRIRWLAFPSILLLAALHQFALYLVADAFPNPWNWWIQLFIYTLTGSIVAWIGITWIADSAEHQYDAEENKRRAYAELEHNHQQLLALHNLGERVAAADDQHAILEIAARAPLELTRARASTVVTFDEEHDRLKLDMAWGLSDNYLNSLRAQLKNGISAGRCQYCSSLTTHIGSDCPLFHGLQTTAQSDGIQSLICLPVVHDDERIGIISAYFPSADGPPEDHIRLLNILGSVIATALENLRTRARELETLYAFDKTAEKDMLGVGETSAIDSIAMQMLNIAAAGWKAQYGELLLYNENTQKWDCHAAIGFDEIHTQGCKPLATEYSQQVYTSGQSIIRTGLDQAFAGLRSFAVIPLKTEGKTIGVLFLGSLRRRGINETHIDLLTTIAHQIALAIHNAQLYAQLGKLAVLQERQRLSREFHDGLAQTLGYLGLQAERVADLVADGQALEASVEMVELRQAIRAAYTDVREAIEGLRLSIAQPDQVAGRLRDYAAAFERQSGLKTIVYLQPENLRTDPGIALQILRIVQEALTNVRKHAQAHSVYIELVENANSLQLAIKDDGRGFPERQRSDFPFHSYGMTTMRERAEGLGGTLSIATSPNEGTRISINIPFQFKENQTVR